MPISDSGTWIIPSVDVVSALLLGLGFSEDRNILERKNPFKIEVAPLGSLALRFVLRHSEEGADASSFPLGDRVEQQTTRHQRTTTTTTM